MRCVSDRPWITAAETCELVMALDAIGEDERARELFDWAQFLRHDDGSYWCGMNFEGERFDRPGQYFTADQPTWNSAAVVLAAHALDGDGPTAGLFRGEGLPGGLPHPRRTAICRCRNPSQRSDNWPLAGGGGRPLAGGRDGARRRWRTAARELAPEQAETAGRRDRREAVAHRPLPDDERRLPAVAGSSNTSWIASRPPGSTNRAQAS